MERMIFAFAIAVALCGCTVSEPYENGLRFVGTFSNDGDTRVEISADRDAGVSRMKWQMSDCIGIFSDAGHVNVPYRCARIDEKAQFLPQNETVSDGNMFWAYYPYASQCDGCTVGVFEYVVPRRQSFVEGDNSDKLFMCATAGKSEDGIVALEFENVLPLLQFELKGDAVLSSLTVDAGVPIAGKTILDLASGEIGGVSETYTFVRVDFGAGGLSLSAEPVPVTLGVLPMDAVGPVTLVFEDISGARFVKNIWQQGMSVPAGVHVLQPLAYINASDFARADIWSDDFSSVELSGSDLFGRLVSGECVYETIGPVALVSGQLRVGKKNSLAYLKLPQLLGGGVTCDLKVEMSVKALSSGSGKAEFYVDGSGSLSENSAKIASTQQYGVVSVSISGADETTRFRFGGDGFYLNSLKITEQNN